MTQVQTNQSKTQGRWTKFEHQQFLIGLELYGKDWKKIEDLIGTRNGAQIRSHAQKFFLRMKKQFELDPSQEQPQPTPTQIPQTKIQTVTKRSQESKNYSYFVQKIVQKSNQKEKFDFWEAFVDHKSYEDMNDMETGIGKRKSSFTAWDQHDLEQIISIQPLKRVKTE